MFFDLCVEIDLWWSDVEIVQEFIQFNLPMTANHECEVHVSQPFGGHEDYVAQTSRKFEGLLEFFIPLFLLYEVHVLHTVSSYFHEVS